MRTTASKSRLGGAGFGSPVLGAWWVLGVLRVSGAWRQLSAGVVPAGSTDAVGAVDAVGIVGAVGVAGTVMSFMIGAIGISV